MIGALLQRPTALSLRSLGLLMECSQDHFTYDALGEQVGVERDRVVDGDIYYYDMIFLTWISKHKNKYLHTAHSSFLFMEICHTIMEGSLMDLTINLLLVDGKNCVFALIDYLTHYLHSLTISI